MKNIHYQISMSVNNFRRNVDVENKCYGFRKVKLMWDYMDNIININGVLSSATRGGTWNALNKMNNGK